MFPNKDKAPDWNLTYQSLQTEAKDARLRAFYSAGMPTDTLPISEVPLVALDLETTGLNHTTDDIVSIGLVPFSTQRIYCSQACHWVVKPNRPLSEESILIHGITHADITEAPTFDTIFEALLSKLAGRVPVVHFRNMEQQFLHTKCVALLGETLHFPVIDTMELEQQALQQRLGLIDRMLKKSTGSVRLSDARKRYSLPPHQTHHALSDAIATAELFQAQVAYHYRPDTPLRDLWLA